MRRTHPRAVAWCLVFAISLALLPTTAARADYFASEQWFGYQDRALRRPASGQRCGELRPPIEASAPFRLGLDELAHNVEPFHVGESHDGRALRHTARRSAVSSFEARLLHRVAGFAGRDRSRTMSSRCAIHRPSLART